MNNRERLEAAIRDELERQTKLGKEIEWGVDALSSHDPVDAFDHAMDVAEHNGDRPIVRACTDLLIKVGYYRPRRGEVVTMGRDRSPVRNGVRYDCVAAFCEWIDN